MTNNFKALSFFSILSVLVFLSLPSLAMEGEEDENVSQKVCRFFNAGYCKYGKKCKFAHVKETPAMSSEEWQEDLKNRGDAGLRELKIQGHLHRKLREKGHPPESNFSETIKVSKEKKLINTPQRDFAEDVRRDRNRAVHQDVGIRKFSGVTRPYGQSRAIFPDGEW